MSPTPPASRLVLLHLDVGSDPISGTLVPPDGSSQQFVGWMQLAAAVERAHEGQPLTAEPSV